MKRLISEDISPFERELLEGALQDRPELAARRRMAAALGVSPLVVYSSVAKAFLTTALGKLGLGAIVGVSVITLHTTHVSDRVEPSTGAPVFAQVVQPLPPANSDPVKSEAGVERRALPREQPRVLGPGSDTKQRASKARPQLHVPGLPAVPAIEQAELVKATPRTEGKGKVKVNGKRTRAPAPERSTLAEEVALLDRARSFVNSGRGAQALSLLDDYRRKFPNGILARESQVLRRRAVGRQH